MLNPPVNSINYVSVNTPAFSFIVTFLVFVDMFEYFTHCELEAEFTNMIEKKLHNKNT